MWDKNRLESLLEVACTQPNTRNALLVTQSTNSAKDAAQFLRKYEHISIKRFYDNYDEKAAFDELCKNNYDTEDTNKIVVLISIKKLDVGGDLPMVDTVVLDLNLNTNSNITDGKKLLQLCRGSRMYNGKHFTQTIFEENDKNNMAICHFLEEYDPNFEITNVYKTDLSNSSTTDWFRDFINTSTPDTILMKSFYDTMVTRKSKRLKLMDEVFDPFMAAFPTKQPIVGETFNVGDICLDGNVYFKKITSEICCKRLNINNPTIKKKLEGVLWLYQHVEQPTKPQKISVRSLKSAALKPSYQTYLRDTDDTKLEEAKIITFMKDILYDYTNLIKTLRLLMKSSKYTFSLRSKVREKEGLQADEKQTVVFESIQNGICENSNFYELCQEVSEKVNLREGGHGQTSAIANKLLLYQLLQITDSGFDKLWLEDRKKIVTDYREEMDKHHKKFDRLKKAAKKRLREGVPEINFAKKAKDVDSVI